MDVLAFPRTWIDGTRQEERGACVTHGWPQEEVPADIFEDVFHSRLRALNRERAPWLRTA